MPSTRLDKIRLQDAQRKTQALGRIQSGELKLHELGREYGEERAAAIRRAYLEDKYGCSLVNVAKASIIDYEDAAKSSAENMIGAMGSIPIGFSEAIVDGEYLNTRKESAKAGAKPVFLATTEGKLISGINRGMKAINESGGATARVLRDHMTRSVAIELSGITQVKAAIDLARSPAGNKTIEEEFYNNTNHGRLKHVQYFAEGKTLFMRYDVETKAAMGMNMVTIASNNATAELVKLMNANGLPAEIITESANFCIDKKGGHVNRLLGRGLSVTAEAVIPKDVVEKVLKTTPEKIVKINYKKNYVGSSLAGSMGNNAQVANVLAATFIAYGQDLAQVVDGANAMDDADITDSGSLYFAVNLPSLEVGTYGGGTRREVQKELLKASGVYGGGDEDGVTKMRFAELIAATCLAGELNLLAAETSGHLTKAHGSLLRK